MDRVAIRLECLKLRQRHDRSPKDIVLEAKIFEEYILGTPEVVAPVTEVAKATPKKKVGNPTTSQG